MPNKACEPQTAHLTCGFCQQIIWSSANKTYMRSTPLHTQERTCTHAFRCNSHLHTHGTIVICNPPRILFCTKMLKKHFVASHQRCTLNGAAAGALFAPRCSLQHPVASYQKCALRSATLCIAAKPWPARLLLAASLAQPECFKAFKCRPEDDPDGPRTSTH